MSDGKLTPGGPGNAAVGPPPVPPGALEAPRARTRLIVDPDDRPRLTTYRETDARSSLTRGLAEYLQDTKLDLPGGRLVRLTHVYDQWPEPEQEIQLPALTCIPHGEGVYDAKSLTPVLDLADRIPAPDGRFPWTWAELVQPIDVELHTSDPAEREGLMALIEEAFAPVDWMAGFRLELPHYFGQHVDFLPQTVGYPDTAETAIERQRIVDFRVVASVSVMVLRKQPTFKTQQQIEVGVAVDVGPLAVSAVPDIDP